MINSKLLASALSLVLVAGFVSPAFANPPSNSNSGPLTPEEISNMQSAHNIVFDNGGAPDGVSYGYSIFTGGEFTLAEDFVLASDTFVKDFHFVSANEPTTIQYAIYSDNGGLPGTELVSGTA